MEPRPFGHYYIQFSQTRARRAHTNSFPLGFIFFAWAFRPTNVIFSFTNSADSYRM